MAVVCMSGGSSKACKMNRVVRKGDRLNHLIFNIFLHEIIIYETLYTLQKQGRPVCFLTALLNLADIVLIYN
jgi:hypothetical protein